MLRWAVQDMAGLRIHATDGDLGYVHDVYLEDSDWRVQYLQVDTRHWLPGRHVLLAPTVVQHLDWDDRRMNVAITRDEVLSSSDIDAHKPISLQPPPRWPECFQWLFSASTSLRQGEELAARLHNLLIEMRGQVRASPEPTTDDPHLWSARALCHFNVEGDNGDLGRVEDILVHQDAWTIPYILIDKGNPLHVTRLLMPVELVHGISWEARRVRVSLAAEALGDPHRSVGTTR